MYTTHFDLLIDECRDWTSGFCGVVNFFTVVVTLQRSCELRGRVGGREKVRSAKTSVSGYTYCLNQFRA